jgi:predicted ATP-grasp superfamily ATP-dependent carboligase
MASGNEHRMVFDIRGKRRHVVKVVYAILAILMGASLFLVVGPVNIGSLIGNSNSGASDLAQEYEEKAERIETELRKQPGSEDLLASLTKNRTYAGQQLLAPGPNGEIGMTVDSRTQYQKASDAWSEYLEAADEPNPNLALQMANVLFSLAQISRTYQEADLNIDAAAEAQKIYAEKRPTLNALSTQALYTLFAGNVKEAEKLNAEAEEKAGSKFQREQLGNQFESAKKNAEEFRQSRAEIEKSAREASKNEGGAGNPESLENPGGFLGGNGLTE